MTDKRVADLKIPDPPRGLKAIPWRLPIWFYRLKLGWLMGHRFVLLTHTGRVSGKPRQAILEVIRYDKDTKTPYVASGFGDKSQWFKNITHTSKVHIQIGSKRFPAIAKRLPEEEAVEVFKAYHGKHPNAIKNLSKMVGYKIGDSEEEIIDFLRLLPVIAFRPQLNSEGP
jgi:deazaflavin-dependent oxidoreductase (nitroreductase family)